VLGAQRLTTVNGQRLKVSSSDAGAFVDGARIVTTDVPASNGVIHVVDAVLLPREDDVVDVALEAGRFTTLAAALDAAGLVEVLKGEGPFTVLAPTDAAFDRLLEGTLASLLQPEERDALTAILTYHVVPGAYSARELVAAGSVRTVEGRPLRVTIDDARLLAGGARIVSTDVEASNGVVHVIDSVLLPE